MEMLEDEERTGLHRRTILKSLVGMGVGTVTFRRALAAQAGHTGTVTPEMIKQAEWIAGLELTEAERTKTAGTVERSLGSYDELRKVDVGYDVPPASRSFRLRRGRRARCGATRRGRLRLPRSGGPTRRGSGVSAGHRAIGVDPQPPGELDGAYQALSRPAQAV